MTICLATTHFAPVPGGIANYYNCLAGLLTDAGHRVIVLTVSDDPVNKEEEIITEGLFTKVTLYSSYKKYLLHYNQYFRPGGYRACSWIATGMAMRDWLLHHAANFKIELVETMDFGGAGVFLKHPDLPPLVIDAHSSAIQIDRAYPMKADDQLALIKKLEGLSFRYADAIIAHSPMNAEEIRTMTQQPVLFCRAPWLLPTRPSNTRQPVSKRFMVISSLQLVKGAEVMIQAAGIAGKNINGLCIYWAGEDSYSAPGGQLTSAYLEKKYPDTWGKQFIWLKQKNREEINRLLSESEAVIIPSLWDTFNYVVPETVYQEIPLILSDKTGAVYLVNEYPTASVFPAGNVDALTSLLIHFNSVEKNRRPDQSPAAYLSVYFSPESILNERLPVYTTIIGQAAGTKQNGIKELSSLLHSYTSPWRKLYYQLRRKIKSLVRPDLANLNTH